MKRFLATTATIALCTAWALAAPARADDAAPADPAATAPQPKTMQDAIDVQIAAAHAQRMQGQFEDAAKAFSQLMLVAPDNGQVVSEYGKVLAQLGRSKDAVAFLARAAQMQPGDWTIYSALGVAYDQLDKRKEARESYDRALALKPGEPSVLNNYAVSRMLAGDYAGAQKMFEQVQAMGMNDPKLSGNLAKLAELEAAHPEKAGAVVAAAVTPTAKAPATHAPASVVALTAPSAQAGVMMQTIPVDPLAGPVGKTHMTRKPATSMAAAKRAEKPVVQAPIETAKPLAVAAIQPKADPATVVMQKIPVDPLAGPVGKDAATHAPTSLIATAKPVAKAADEPAKPVAIAAAQPKVDPATVVMQKVPTDPLAGPVAPHEPAAAPHALASAAPKAASVKNKKDVAVTTPKASTVSKPAAAKPKTELAKAAILKLAAPPALRTASDSN